MLHSVPDGVTVSSQVSMRHQAVMASTPNTLIIIKTYIARLSSIKLFRALHLTNHPLVEMAIGQSATCNTVLDRKHDPCTKTG